MHPPLDGASRRHAFIVPRVLLDHCSRSCTLRSARLDGSSEADSAPGALKQHEPPRRCHPARPSVPDSSATAGAGWWCHRRGGDAAAVTAGFGSRPWRSASGVCPRRCAGSHLESAGRAVRLPARLRACSRIESAGRTVPAGRSRAAASSERRHHARRLRPAVRHQRHRADGVVVAGDVQERVVLKPPEHGPSCRPSRQTSVLLSGEKAPPYTTSS